MFVTDRASMDIPTVIAVLSMLVRAPNKDNRNKIVRNMRYI